MRALITSPRDDSEPVALALQARGLDVMIEPLLDIAPTGTTVDLGGIQGILATSANGVRALSRAVDGRSLPVWAVGDGSARCARELGWTTVESAGGDVDTLAELVAGRVDPSGGALLHAAGTAVAGDLGGRLAARGFSVRKVALYEARTAAALSPGLAGALAAGGIDLALFFSPRTAATFVSLVEAAGLAGSLSRVAAYTLSANVARALAGPHWRRVREAAAPTQAALLAVLDDDLPEPCP